MRKLKLTTSFISCIVEPSDGIESVWLTVAALTASVAPKSGCAVKVINDMRLAANYQDQSTDDQVRNT